MKHIVLLGDSVFDNASYVGGGPAVIDHLSRTLPADWKVTLLAVDGDTTSGVLLQVSRTPADASHLIVSAGGNDALGHLSFLDEPAQSVAEVLTRLGSIVKHFAQDYGRMLDAVVARGLPVCVCTIYDPRFPDSSLNRLASIGLSAFNDAILRQAFSRRLPVVDLRLVCNDDADYANPIEPSVQGGAKIASAIKSMIFRESEVPARAEVFSGV